MIYKKLEGIIFGMAVGCSLGNPVSSEPRDKIVKLFGSSGITDFAPSLEGPPGSIGKTCKMALEFLRIIIESPDASPDELEEKFRETCSTWKIQRPGISILCGVSAGIYYTNKDLMAKLATRIGAVTEGSEASIASSLASSYAVSLAMENYTPYEVVEGGISMFYEIHRGSGKLKEVFNVVELDENEFDRKVGPEDAHEDILLRSFYAFIRNTSFESAVLTSVNLSGPSDIQGGFTGALSGCYVGAQKIPRKWTERLEDREKLLSLSRETYRTIIRSQIEEPI